MTTVKVHRRDFLRVGVTSAAGLVLGFTLPERDKLEAQFPPPPVYKPTAFIHIGKDESVTFILPKAEMGQGPLTSLSQILAEELDADWTKVRAEFAPVDPALYGKGKAKSLASLVKEVQNGPQGRRHALHRSRESDAGRIDGVAQHACHVAR